MELENLHAELEEARKSLPPRSKPAQLPSTQEASMVKQGTEGASFAAYNTFEALLKYQVAQGVMTMWDFQSQMRTGGLRNTMTYREVRALADEADLIRIAIEDVKSTIKGLDWEIGVEKGVTLRPEAELWVQSPDKATSWDIWATQLAEEFLVTDAPCLFPWLVKGALDRLEVVDGTTISYLTDRNTGRLPDSPKPCYEQPQVNGKPKQYNKDQLWLLPQNRRVGTLRGFSPVEQVAARASVNISKVMRDMFRWLKGGTPPGVVGTPDTMDFETLKKYQKWLDEMIKRPAGDSLLTAVAGQGKVTTIPPIPFTKEHEESLARIICKAIGSDPTSLVSEVNYNTSDALQRWAALRGVRPVLWFLVAVVGRGLALAGFPGHKLVWKAEREAEEFARRQEELAEYESGLLAWEEVRENRGREIKPGALKGKHFMVVGKNLQTFDPLADPAEVKPDPPSSGFPWLMDTGGDRRGVPKPQEGGPGDGEGGAGKSCPHCGEGGGGLYKAAFFRTQEAQDLGRWERVARKALKAGEAPREFKSAHIPTWKQAIIRKALLDPDHGLGVFKAGGLRKAVDHLGRGIGVTTSARARRQEAEGPTLWQAIFLPMAEAITAEALEAAQKKGLLEKAGGLGDVPPPSLEAWRKLIRWLEENYQIGVDDTASLLGHGILQDAAYGYALERAAALLGRKWDPETESWISNPDERFAIPGKMRGAANELVAQAVDEGWSLGELKGSLSDLFSPDRALTIARTELGFAYNTGAAMNYAAQGVTHVLVRDGGQPGSCEECNAVDGQIWTITRSLEEPLAHPNCTRVFLPVDEAELEEAA